MAIYENKFEIGDKVVVTNKMQCIDLWEDMASVMEVKNFSNGWPDEREVHKVISYTIRPKTTQFIYHVKNCITEKGYLMLEDGLDLYNGQDKEKVEQSSKYESCKEVTKTGYVKCEKFTSICEYLTEGKVYRIKEYKTTNLVIINDQGRNTWLPSVGRQDLHTGSVWQYTTEEEYLAQQTPKQQYKPRAKWVKNTGEKPDLPDGTLVKILWDNGTKEVCTVGQYNWNIKFEGDDIVKWKVADDWNKVVDGQAPDIDASTLVEVKNTKESGGGKFEGVVENLAWDMVKKWRYAKEKKAK